MLVDMKPGEILEHEGKRYLCVASGEDYCDGCDFWDYDCSELEAVLGSCSGVCFKEVSPDEA